MEKKEYLNILSDIPGRVRFQFKEKPKKMPNMDKLLEIEGIKEVTYNKITRSLLILYDSKYISLAQLLVNLKNKISGIVISHLLKDSKQASFPIENLISRTVYETVRKANKKTNQTMKGYADLTSLAPGILFLLGMGSLFVNPIIPKWYDFLWYSYNVFLQHNKKYREEAFELEK